MCVVKLSRLLQNQVRWMLDVTHLCVNLSHLTQRQSDITEHYIGYKHKLDSLLKGFVHSKRLVAYLRYQRGREDRCIVCRRLCLWSTQ
jgi:hypothetical protein